MVVQSCEEKDRFCMFCGSEGLPLRQISSTVTCTGICLKCARESVEVLEAYERRSAEPERSEGPACPAGKGEEEHGD